MTTSAVPPATGMRVVDMDPALANTIGLHHSLATAVADLVDNSLDATADTIRIRFLLDGSAPIGLQVVDDGRGMDSIAVDRAMTFAGTRDYRDSDLGHFGVGLKAASLSQADTVLVYSRAYGSTAVGRKLVRSGERTAPRVGTISTADAAYHLDHVEIGIPLDTGTIVEWRDGRSFPTTSNPQEQRRWLEQAIRDLRAHLGLILHRILDDVNDRPDLAVDTWDVTKSVAGVPRQVRPIDPFGYRRSGDPDFPQQLDIRMPDGSQPVHAVAHIWPARSQDPGFKIGGEPGVGSQGIFAYRRDRLIQAGGWCGLWGNRPAWELARVELDLTESAPAHVTVNPEKSGLEFSSDLRRALEAATCRTTGLTLSGFLERAAGEERRSRSRTRRPVTVVEPRGGLPADVLDAYGQTVGYKTDVPPIDIRWRTLPAGEVFRVDRDHDVLALNLRYRAALVGGPSLDPEDAPVIKTLLHLLLSRYFEGSFLGVKEKTELAAWQAILLAAVSAQIASSLSNPDPPEVAP
jgi:hypothetical protein